MRVELYFDFSCPYAYLAQGAVEPVVQAAGATLCWRPMLLGGVFRGLGMADTPMARLPPVKARHNLDDMQRWARRRAVPLRMPAGHPLRTVRALRALLSLAEATWPPVIHAIYRAYWVDGIDISTEDGLRQALARGGVTGDALDRALRADGDEAIKEELRRRTDEALARGVFGAPAFFVDREDGSAPLPFWGQDRLDMVAATLDGWDPDGGRPPRPGPASAVAALPRPPRPGATGRGVDFWYDFSSPFAYLGSTQIERAAADAGATVTWRPMLLGAVFREIGTPNVPLFAVSEPRRRYLGRELAYWASFWGVPFRFNRRFPQNTVTALRLAIQAGPAIAPLSHALYRAMWVDDRDLQDEATLRALVAAQGLDADALLAGAATPAVKQALFESTAAAIAAGVFGAPTTVAKVPGAADQLFWGQDRLELVTDALCA